MDFDSRALRDALGRFPTGVTVMTSGAPGMEYGMTCQSFSSLSLDPPLILVCVANEAGILPMLQETGAFTVNVLSAAQESLSGFFASSSRPPPPHQFDDVAHSPGVTGTARIAGATTVLRLPPAGAARRRRPPHRGGAGRGLREHGRRPADPLLPGRLPDPGADAPQGDA